MRARRAATWPALLLALLLALAPLDRLPLSVLGLTVSAYRVLSLPILLCLLFGLFRYGSLPWPGLRSTPVLLSSLLLVMALSSLFADDPPLALAHLLRFVEYALIVLLLYMVLRLFWSKRHWPFLAWGLLASASLASITVLTDFFEISGFYLLYEADRPFVRHVGLLGEANYAAAKLGVLLPFILYLGARSARGRHRMTLSLVIGAGLLVATALFVTGSRTGGLLAAVALAAFLVREFRWILRARVLLTAVAIGGLLLGSFFAFGAGPFAQALRYVTERYGVLVSFIGTGQERFREVTETSLQERFEVSVAGLSMFADHPLLGVGLANFPPSVGSYDPRYAGTYSHNTYLSALTELGVLGGLFFVLLCWRVFRLLVAGAAIDRDTRFYLALSYALLLLSFLFLHELDNKYFWTLFLPMALYFERGRAGRGSSVTGSRGP